MPVFVHLTPERNLAAIRRRGITAPRGTHAREVFALPVTRNFYVSHQWLRELRRSGAGAIFGVYFRLPDEYPVLIGHYGSRHVEMTAAQAVRVLMDAEQRDPAPARAHDLASRAIQRGHRLPTSPEGYEVIIPGSIPKSQILRIKALPQVVGWRYRPGANGEPPCACICCERGRYGIQKLLRKVEGAEVEGKPSKISLFGRPGASYERVERQKRERGKSD